MKTVVCLLFLTLSLSACDHVQGDREVEMDPAGIPKGPGIFTGRSGEWNVIKR